MTFDLAGEHLLCSKKIAVFYPNLQILVPKGQSIIMAGGGSGDPGSGCRWWIRRPQHGQRSPGIFLFSSVFLFRVL
jgi:hypothetical protein